MLNIFDIKNFALNDGPGIRTTFFLVGCPLSCRWCQNPEGKKGVNKNTRSIQKAREYNINEIFSLVMKQLDLYRISGGGITFSGGDPLVQADDLLEVLKKLKNLEIHITIETSLAFPIKEIEKIINYVDLFIIDLKPLNSIKAIYYTGQDEKKALEGLKFLKSKNKFLYLRSVAIDNVTIEDENLVLLYKIIDELKGKELLKVELLTYHRLAIPKYEEIGEEFINFINPSKEKIDEVLDEIKKILRETDTLIDYLKI